MHAVEKANGRLRITGMSKDAKFRKMALFTAGGKFQVAGSLDTSGDVPRQRFIKDIIHTGMYVHPKHGWKLDVTPERMDRWVASFKAMQKNGVDAEVVVDHSEKAKDIQGELVDMCRDGDTLYAVHEMVGEDAIKLAHKCKNVSPLIERDFKDGQGNSYGEAITHSSLVQQPVVPGQHPFMPIAASMAGMPNSDIEPFVLSLEGSESEQEKTQEKTMDIKFEDIKALLGAGDDLTEDNAMDRLKDHFKKTADSKAEADKQILDLRAELESYKKKAAEPAAKKLDDDVADQLAESAEAQVDDLVRDNKIVPSVAASLKAEFIGRPGKRNAYALSRTVSGMDESLFRKVVKLFRENNVVELGEKTKGQRKELSRQVPGKEETAHDPKVTESMVNMAGGAEKK